MRWTTRGKTVGTCKKTLDWMRVALDTWSGNQDYGHKWGGQDRLFEQFNRVK